MISTSVSSLLSQSCTCLLLIFPSQYSRFCSKYFTTNQFLKERTMETCAEEKWASLIISSDNAVMVREAGEDDDDEEEALSFCDLPLIHLSRKQIIAEEESVPLMDVQELQEDFDFRISSIKDSDMCAADEVFFRGRILPLSRSLSSEKGLLRYGRSESMDCQSIGLFSSRSSSRQSSSSSGSSAATPPPRYKSLQNHFLHSHPCPSPRLRTSPRSQGIMNGRNSRPDKTSSLWTIFRMGISVTSPAEIAVHNLKTRCPVSNIKSKSIGINRNASARFEEIDSGKKRLLPKSRALLGACKFSMDAIDTQTLRGPAMGTKSLKARAGKKQLAHHRTFEWLKQLSIESAED